MLIRERSLTYGLCFKEILRCFSHSIDLVALLASYTRTSNNNFHLNYTFRQTLHSTSIFYGFVLNYFSSKNFYSLFIFRLNINSLSFQKCLTDGANLNNSLSNQLASLDRAKRNYEKSFRDSEKAVESYQKADADLNLSRADVERHKITMNSKIQLSDDAKNEYANQLQKTNNLQQQHYDVLMPDVTIR